MTRAVLPIVRQLAVLLVIRLAEPAGLPQTWPTRPSRYLFPTLSAYRAPCIVRRRTALAQTRWSATQMVAVRAVPPAVSTPRGFRWKAGRVSPARTASSSSAKPSSLPPRTVVSTAKSSTPRRGRSTIRPFSSTRAGLRTSRASPSTSTRKGRRRTVLPDSQTCRHDEDQQLGRLGSGLPFRRQPEHELPRPDHG